MTSSLFDVKTLSLTTMNFHESNETNILLTHWGWDKMAAISQKTLSNAFSCMKMLKIWLKFHWSLFLRVQLTIQNAYELLNLRALKFSPIDEICPSHTQGNDCMNTTLKSESCHDANFAITGDTGGCHNNNVQCHQWRQSWHLNYNSQCHQWRQSWYHNENLQCC